MEGKPFKPVGLDTLNLYPLEKGTPIKPRWLGMVESIHVNTFKILFDLIFGLCEIHNILSMSAIF